MKSETVVMCVVALLLGMLLANMLKSVCGCKTVEGVEVNLPSCPDADGTGFIRRPAILGCHFNSTKEDCLTYYQDPPTTASGKPAKCTTSALCEWTPPDPAEGLPGVCTPTGDECSLPKK